MIHLKLMSRSLTRKIEKDCKIYVYGNKVDKITGMNKNEYIVYIVLMLEPY